MLRFFLNKIVNRSISSVLFVAMLIGNLLLPVKAFALTSGPSQPEFEQFSPAGASEMVNLFTGDFSYNIPLMDVEGYPINISYQAGAQMEDEASWVGLGWNINSGAIRRGLRGLPDDFAGDKIERSIHMSDHEVTGGTLGFAYEFAGKKVALNGSVGLQVGGTFDNYTGFGSQLALDFAMAANLQKTDGGPGGALTAGLGLDVSSNDGANFRSSYGMSARYSNIIKGKSGSYGASLGVNYSTSVNSREGVKNQSLSFSASVQHAKHGVINEKNHVTSKSGIGLGTNFSTVILASSYAYLPQIPFDAKSTMWSVDVKVGSGSCFNAWFGAGTGFHSKNQLLNGDKSFNGFGYLNEELNASAANPILDFSREKDGVMYKESPNMAVTSHNYDMFSATAQGFSGNFRAHRNDIGVVFDPPGKSNSDGNAIGVEVAIGTGVNIGVNYNGVFNASSSGKWPGSEDDIVTRTDFAGDTKFSSSVNTSSQEKYHFSFNGENTPNDAVFLSQVGGKDAVSASLVSRGNKTYGTDPAKYKGSAVALPLSPRAYATARKARNQLVSTINAEKAQFFAVEKDIKNYTDGAFTLNSNGDVSSYIGINRKDLVSYPGSKSSQHISEITATSNSGARYVYGLPVYNKFQKEVSFNVSKSCSQNLLLPDANSLVDYVPGSDNTKSNGHGNDNYYEANVTPPYVHSYLLTSVLSSDYVDLTGDGPSTDDYGNYVKFNFTKQAPYAWRIPVSASDNKAMYNKGSYADVYDDKASYTYGIKDVWFQHSIETKNFVAEYILEDRNDAKGVSYEPSPTLVTFTNESSKADPNATLKRLKEIRLYNKQDLMTNGTNAVPVKVAHFEYDYTLCKNLPNTIGGTGQNGKLTLKKIYFTYGNSQKGVFNPYQFAYNDQADHNFAEDGGSYSANPNYNPTETDRWGVYKPNGTLNNILYPYTQQQDKNLQDTYARAWCLNTIKTPSGSTIKIDYESDDYAYIMEKRAGQMFKILGYSPNANGTSYSGSLYTGNNTINKYAVIDISTVPSGLYDSFGQPVNYLPASLSQADANNYVQNNYLTSLSNLFFKVKTQLTNDGSSWEYIPGYADINSYAAVKLNGSTNYNAIVLELKNVSSGDKQYSSELIHPVTKAALQYGRKYLNGVMYPYVQSCSYPTAMQRIQQVQGLVNDIKARFGGVNHSFIKRNFCSNTVPAESFVRLMNPNFKKLGGGLRVKKIAVSDEWNGMAGSELTHAYAQSYDYTTLINGVTASSGVASYEPMIGGDENSYRAPVITSFPSNLSVNDEMMIETPVGESMLPSPLVGYSKVTVQNLYDNISGSVTIHKTGKTEYEFYTNKDFPNKITQTGLEKQIVKPKGISKYIKFKSQERMYLTQGYAIKVNDMHGKPRSVKNFAEGQSAAVSGIEYTYKCNGNDLDNNVSVVDRNNVISTKEVAVDVDVVNDSRMAKQKTQAITVSSNICTFSCSYYIPLIFIWPGYSKITNEFYSLGTTKTIQQYGLIDEVVTFDNNSSVRTKNDLYDAESGEVLMTKTTNQYNDPVYNFSYPAHWKYQGMAPAYKNIGAKFFNLVDNTGRVTISAANSILSPGDEIGIYNSAVNPANLGPAFYQESLSASTTRAWVIRDQAPGATNTQFFLIDKDGACITGLQGANQIFEVLRSGSRNMQNTPIGSITSKKDPKVNNALSFDNTKQILNASAVEYDDKWNLYCPSVYGKDSVEHCHPVTTVNFSIFKKLFECNLSPANLTYAALQYYVGENVIYSSQPSPPAIVSPPGCSTLTNSELDVLLALNALPSLSALNASSNATQWTQVIFNLTIAPNYNSFVFTLELQPWQFQQNSDGNGSGVVPHGDRILGNCPITFSKVVPLATITFYGNNLSFSNFTTGITGQSANTFQITVTDAVSPYTFSGVWQGTISCVTLYSQLACTWDACRSQVTQINPYVENVRGNWRAKRSFSYLVDRAQGTTQASGVMKGDARDDGYYASFKPFWNFSGSVWTPIYKLASQQGDVDGYLSKWTQTSEVNKTDRYGNTLQVQNEIRKPSAALFGYNFTRPFASASNALYTDIAFDGFEDYAYVKNVCIEHFKFFNNKISLTTDEQHTGRYSMRVNPDAPVKVRGNLNSSCNFNDNLGVQSGAPAASFDITQDVYPARAANATGIFNTGDCDCAGRFGPLKNKATDQKYVMSVWVKQNTNVANINTYSGVGAAFLLNGVQLNTAPPKLSKLIDGWQKMDYEFTVPLNSNQAAWEVNLYNNSAYSTAYFDDFRIHPFNASMGSSVYDPYSLRLWADLDDRNYATFYEYDEEGSLVRVKKETEKGIYTIKEVRSALKKQP